MWRKRCQSRNGGSNCRQLTDRLARLPCGSPDVIRFAGERLASLGQLWDGMTMAEKREACRILFEEVRMDTGRKQLRLRPWPEFEPLFAMRREMLMQANDVGMVPPAGLEPTHPAPEAGALSD